MGVKKINMKGRSLEAEFYFSLDDSSLLRSPNIVLSQGTIDQVLEFAYNTYQTKLSLGARTEGLYSLELKEIIIRIRDTGKNLTNEDRYVLYMYSLDPLSLIFK